MRLQSPIQAVCAAWLFVVALFVSPAKAQVCVPDGLDQGPCCVNTFPTLPQFPQMNAQSIRWVCFDNCKPVANTTMCATIFAPQPKQFQGALLCGVYDIRVRIRQCGINVGLWQGTLNGYYSRNWNAVTPAGTKLTVWRFIVNGDLTPTINVPNNQNFRPACQPFTQQVYFSGYIDYALDCTTNQWQVAWMLDHDCDGVHHTPTSARPAPAVGYHPTRSYNIIGPGAGFVVAPLNPVISNGPITQGATRGNTWATAPMICTFEERAQGNFAPMADFCSCSTASATPQYNMAQLVSSGVCGTQVLPSINGPMNQKRLGSWTNPNVYPGIQSLLFDFGWADYIDGCSGALSTEWFEGVETIGGFPAIDFNGLALDRQFEDLMSCNKAPTSPAPLVGAPHVVNWILNYNLP
ncbi:MAG: hypothetical protein L6Q99_03545 [Planctomycetes bacterium]|nr:hypothetical protein [Planctomycetota bacterium]